MLKPGGITRIVVPDMAALCRTYLQHLEACEQNENLSAEHDRAVSAIIEQCVRREAAGSARQKPLRRYLENLVLGDARARGETHQWMYDKINLSSLLKNSGFSETFSCTYNDSQIPGWKEYGLDTDTEGAEYRPGSLYLEARV